MTFVKTAVSSAANSGLPCYARKESRNFDINDAIPSALYRLMFTGRSNRLGRGLCRCGALAALVAPLALNRAGVHLANAGWGNTYSPTFPHSPLPA